MVRTVDTADELLAFLRNWNVDGLFVAVFSVTVFDTLSTLDLPMVFIDSYVKHLTFITLVWKILTEAFWQPVISLRTDTEKSLSLLQVSAMAVYFRNVFSAIKQPSHNMGLRLINIVFEYEMDLPSCRELAKQLTAILDLAGIVASADIMAAGIMTGLRDLWCPCAG